MTKRTCEEFEDEVRDHKRFLEDLQQGDKKHTLDSDESDNEDERQMHPDDIEGEEAGTERVDAEEEIKFTPFNMKEELEEGHFDEFGHYNLNKKDERHLDNWLDDIDWVKVKKDEDYRKKYYAAEGEYSSDSDEDTLLPQTSSSNKFDSKSIFKEILSFMQPKEDINKTLQRLNKSKMKISTAQRFKMKKQGITDEASEQITKLTGLTNEVLTKTGNMNVYDLTYEQIQLKVSKSETPTAGGSKDVELDMYADDFDEKEKEKKVDPKAVKIAEEIEEKETELMWEYKMKAEDEKIQGPFTTFIMSKKAENGDFKDGAVARKVGDERFYSASRIDFELYL